MTEKGKQAVLKLMKDPKTSKALEAANVKTLEEFVKVLKANGYDITLEDVAQPEAKNKKVSLDEAKAVAGGTTCACVIGGGGSSTCYCAVGGGGGPNGADGSCVCAVGGGGSW